VVVAAAATQVTEVQVLLQKKKILSTEGALLLFKST